MDSRVEERVETIDLEDLDFIGNQGSTSLLPRATACNQPPISFHVACLFVILMASGRPIIATDHGGASDQVINPSFADFRVKRLFS